jgi:DNA invertase Pin-like site-specific DNA recombinase
VFRPRLLDAPPGLDYALKRIAAGDAQGLVVPGLRRLARSAAELGPIVEWFIRRRARLVAVAQGFDTGELAGQVAARMIVEVSRWEREWLWEPTREGHSPSPGSTASTVSDDEPELVDSNEGGAS